MTTLPTMYYSTDDQKTWTQYNFANGNDLGVKGDIINIPANGKIYLKGNNTTFEESTYDLDNLNNIICLHTSASSKVGGDIRSILDETLSITTLPDYAFLGLLAANEYLVSAADLKLLINGNYSYYDLFSSDINLINPPILSSMNLADSCYSYMFYNCTSLITPPALLAETMTLQCYFNMFNGCSSMTTAPTLPAMNLANYCYEGMLRGTAITESPELSATTLATGCYSRMFTGCSNLNKITLAYTGDFNTTYFNEWVDGVAASGDFYYNGSDTTHSTSAIPVGWTVRTF